MNSTSDALLRPLCTFGDERWTGLSWLRALVPAPDGRRLWGLAARHVFAWDVATGERVVEVPAECWSLAVLPGSLLVGRGSAIERWSLEGSSLGVVRSWPEKPRPPPIVAACSEVLVSVQRKALTREDAGGSRTVQLPFAPKKVRVSPRGDRVLAFATNASSAVVLSYGPDGEVTSREWDAGTRVWDAALLDDGTCLLAGGGKRLALLDLRKLRLRWTRADAGQGSLALAADGTHALLYTETRASLVRVSDGLTRATFRRSNSTTSWGVGAPTSRGDGRSTKRPEDGMAVAVAPDASWVALREESGAAECFYADGSVLGAPRGARAPGGAPAWAPDGRTLYTGCDTGPELTAWSVDASEPVAALEHSRPGTSCVLPSPDGRYLAVCCRPSDDCSVPPSVLVLERTSGLVLAELKGPDGRDLWGELHWAPDASALVVLVDYAPALWVLPTDTWRPRLRWTGKTPRTLLLGVDRDAARLWVGDRVRDVPLCGDDPIQEPPRPPDNVSWIWHTPPTILLDGTLLGSPVGYPAQRAEVVGRLCRWDIDTRKVRWRADAGEAVSDLAPSRRWMLTTRFEELRVRALDDGRLLATMPAPNLSNAALSPRGDLAAWVSHDGVLRCVSVDAAALDRATLPPNDGGSAGGSVRRTG